MDPDHVPGVYPFGESLLHPLKVWATALPGSLFALVALWPGFAGVWDERGRRLLQEMHCWVWPSLLFWSVVPEHAIRHSGPLFPGIAGLAALAWVACSKDGCAADAAAAPAAWSVSGVLAGREGVHVVPPAEPESAARGTDCRRGAGREDVVPVPPQGRRHHVLLRPGPGRHIRRRRPCPPLASPDNSLV
jgi:hypothetical protein